MADKLMLIPTKLQFCRLQLVVETLGHSTILTNKLSSSKVPKVVKPPNKETLL